ncbi:NADH-quinone oxidoreductase subunit NuoB [bacterium]|nr:NADH-quinone oxidoreductase subunit NuoB [bacterium]
MIRLLKQLLDTGCKSQRTIINDLPNYALGLPAFALDKECTNGCKACVETCPTSAIEAVEADFSNIQLDLGACIGCNLCVETCPSGMLKSSLTTATSTDNRNDLVLGKSGSPNVDLGLNQKKKGIFKQSLAIRVVSTGCSACDLEIGAAFNPIFDASRFGLSLVASPRAADALLVTGPCPKGMHEPLRRTYEAMSEPKLVIACGSCAISGGIHKHGYAEANGLDSILPVDVYIPGCPPHPWSIIHGLQKAMSL